MKTTILQVGQFRIVEIPDMLYNIEDLKGDSYCPITNPDIPAEQLKKEERKFELDVDACGVFGYVLEKWNPEVGKGWEHVESCWGFVGTHDMNNHYIVHEFETMIK